MPTFSSTGGSHAEGKAEIAKAMLAKGFDAATILALTGLTAEQLSALK